MGSEVLDCSGSKSHSSRTLLSTDFKRNGSTVADLFLGVLKLPVIVRKGTRLGLVQEEEATLIYGKVPNKGRSKTRYEPCFHGASM